MQAYEFITKPEDGVIRIPERFKSKITTTVKVIILNEEQAGFKKSDLLLAPALDTRDFRFNREEANER